MQTYTPDKVASELLNKIYDLTENEYLKKYQDTITDVLKIRSVDLSEHLSEVNKAYQLERLVIVLGAGVSAEYGLPDWETLLQKLLLGSFTQNGDGRLGKSAVLAKFFTKAFTHNPLIAARYLRNHYKNNNRDYTFEQAVREALYDSIDNSIDSEFFNELAQLCIAPGKKPNLDSLITYNYDDILEKHLDALKIGFSYKSISEVGVNAGPGQFPIYHVHGFLPRDGELGESNNITLSEDAYHQQYHDTYSWNNLVQINKFRDKSCLFIGLSLKDPNIRRLLDIANQHRGGSSQRHYVLRKKYDPEYLISQLNSILKMHPELREGKKQSNVDLESAATDLINVMERFETQDDRSFSIETIWLNSFEQIPKILRAIREGNADLAK